MANIYVYLFSGETIATYDVPNHSNDLASLHESVKILQQEINQTLTSLVEGAETNDGGSGSGEEELDEDSDDDDCSAINGNKRKLSNDEFNKKLKTS